MKGIKEERLYVLNLLGEGKITADEATSLLESLAATEQIGYVSFEEYDAEDKLEKFSKSVECFAKDFSGKIENTFKDMEPKVRKTTKAIMEKTAVIIDDISNSLNESIKNMDSKINPTEADDTVCNDCPESPQVNEADIPCSNGSPVVNAEENTEKDSNEN